MFYVILFNPSTKTWMDAGAFKTSELAHACIDQIKAKLPWAKVSLLESK